MFGAMAVILPPRGNSLWTKGKWLVDDGVELEWKEWEGERRVEQMWMSTWVLNHITVWGNWPWSFLLLGFLFVRYCLSNYYLGFLMFAAERILTWYSKVFLSVFSRRGNGGMKRRQGFPGMKRRAQATCRYLASPNHACSQSQGWCPCKSLGTDPITL